MTDDPRYPPIEPYDSGLLDVGDGNAIYWEACGNPDGKPALVVHGGPGSGCGTGSRRYFDPERYRIVLFDQRGCGRSVPHASDPATDMSANTTHHLIADMERLREHLGIERWLLYGGSWGSTLILAYAQRFPERVSEIVITGVTVTRRSDVDWLYRGVGRFFPEAWTRFRDGAPENDRDDLVAAYARLVESPDAAVREQATRDWLAWEDAVISLEENGSPGAYSDRPPDAALALVRICARYFSHGAWLEEGELLANAGRLVGIPGALLHGRHDLGSPVGVAWELAQAWPGSELVVVEDSGHTGSETFRKLLLQTTDRFAG
jgi:proline iminopeptidase